jgi:hypothetical protein
MLLESCISGGKTAQDARFRTPSGEINDDFFGAEANKRSPTDVPGFSLSSLLL